MPRRFRRAGTFWAPGGPGTGVVGQLGRLVRRGLMVARVVHQPAEGGVGELLGLDVVAPPQLHRVQPDLGGQRVHGPLDGVGGLGPAGAAVGVRRRHVREHRRTAEVVGLRDVVDAGVEEGAEQRDARGDELQVRTHVAQQPDPDGGQPAVLVGGQLDVLDLPAALDGGQGVLGSALVPPDGHAVLPRQGHAQQLLGVHVELRAERASDLRCHDPHEVLGDAESDGRHDLEDVRDLRRRVERRPPAERFRHRDDRTGLHGHRDEPLLDVALLDGVRGGGERGVDRLLADLELPGVRLVRTGVVVDDHAVGQRVFEADHGFERLVLDVDGAERVLGFGLAPGQHHGHGVAHVAGLRHGHRVVRRVLHVGRHRPRAGHGRAHGPAGRHRCRRRRPRAVRAQRSRRCC